MSDYTQGIRERMIAALDYPKRLMDRDIKRQTCPHQHIFNQKKEECEGCLYILECQCASDKLEPPQLQARSNQELGKLLQFGIEYVGYHELREGHCEAGCDCDLCGWLKITTPLLVAVGLSTALGPSPRTASRQR